MTPGNVTEFVKQQFADGSIDVRYDSHVKSYRGAITAMATGMVIFHSLEQALQSGFEYYDRPRDGYYLVRRRNMESERWELALATHCS